MSAFKKLDRRNVFTTAHQASKAFSDSSGTSTYGVQFLLGTSGSLPIYSSTTTDELRYRSVKQLYYSNYVNDSNIITGSFENYLQSSLHISGSRNLFSKAAVVSYPRRSTGEGIKPGTIVYDLAGLGDYIINQSDYVLQTQAAGGLYIETGSIDGGIIKDDGDGRLKVDSGTPFSVSTGTTVGNVFYSHGIAVMTHEDLVDFFAAPNSLTFDWKSLQSIYTLNLKCKVKDSEFNFSLNPSATRDDNGNLADNITGSEFRPYVTTVGLYNDYGELVAVAKLNQPIPKSTDTDMTFEIKLDI
jgi:hypothetical protein